MSKNTEDKRNQVVINIDNKNPAKGLIVKISKSDVSILRNNEISISLKGSISNSSNKSIFIEEVENQRLAIADFQLVNEDGLIIKGFGNIPVLTQIYESYRLIRGVNEKNVVPEMTFFKDISILIDQEDFAAWEKMKYQKLTAHFTVKIRLDYNVIGVGVVENSEASIPVNVPVQREQK